MKPAGLEKAAGIISAAYTKDPTDPQWQDTPEYKEWLAWMKQYNPSGNVADAFTVTATPWRRQWSPSSKQAATISPART